MTLGRMVCLLSRANQRTHEGEVSSLKASLIPSAIASENDSSRQISNKKKCMNSSCQGRLADIDPPPTGFAIIYYAARHRRHIFSGALPHRIVLSNLLYYCSAHFACNQSTPRVAVHNTPFKCLRMFLVKTFTLNENMILDPNPRGNREAANGIRSP